MVDRIGEIAGFAGKNVLDVGCGWGALAYVVAKRNGDPCVCAVDVSRRCLDGARRHCNGLNVAFAAGSAERLPFSSTVFDVVVLFDVLEHVGDVEEALRECARVLKRQGLLYVEFAPYYCLVSGHHMYGFTFLPLQFLPEAFVRHLVSLKGSAADLETLNSLNRLTIQRFQRLVKRFSLEVLADNYVVKYSPFAGVSLKPLKYLGVLRELAAMAYVSVLRKH